MVADEMKTREDIWGEIRENFIAELTTIFCQDEHNPFDIIKAKDRATRIADRLVSAICERAGGRKLSVPHVPRCLRLVRNGQLFLDFNGANHAQIGASALYRPVSSRHVRRILKLAKEE